MNKVMPLKVKQWEQCAAEGHCPELSAQNLAKIECVNGNAGGFPCCNVDLLSFVSLATLGAGGDASDIWGWFDPVDNKEYAIAGVFDGTSFVDVTDPVNPSVLGFLRTHTVGSSWRDIKVYKDHAFIISEARGHGMQVFDLTQLRDLPRVSIFDSNSSFVVPELAETAFYGEFGNCHNIAINEETGYAYGVGSNTCRAGLHMIDISDPVDPTFAGCFSDDGYVHDTQCVLYDGPDTAYTQHEICFCYNEDTLTIVDVTIKNAPVMLARQSYTGYQYTHQGWALPGLRYLLLDDELDEMYNSIKQTRTMVWNVENLARPFLVNSFYSRESVIDHNQYTLGDRTFQSNYCGGLRILDTSDVITSGGELKEVGFFDVAPSCSTTQFLGTWSNYPYLPSGNILVSSIERGMFVVKYNGAAQGCL